MLRLNRLWWSGDSVYLLGEDELMEVILQVVGHARAAVPVVHGEEGELRVSLSSKWSYVLSRDLLEFKNTKY